MQTNSFDQYGIDTFDSFKGILILFIVIGHINQLMIGYSFGILYAFHVSSFLFIPFLFNNDLLNKKNLLKILKRYYIPFFIFIIINTVIFTIFLKSETSFLSLIQVLFFGTRDYLRETTGSMYLWFFPTLITTLILIMIVNSFFKNHKKYLFILMYIFHLTLGLIPNQKLMNLPLGLAISLYIFSLGMIVSYLYNNKIFTIEKYIKYIIVLFLISLMYLYGNVYNLGSIVIPDISSLNNIISLDIAMITGFFTILYISKKVKNDYLIYLGKNSIVIFTIHTIFIYALNYMFKSNTIYFGLFVFIVTISCSLVYSKVIIKFNLKKYIYPR